MALILHVVIALSSIIFTGFTYFIPSSNKLRLSYAFVVLTLASGVYLVVQTHAPLLSSCLTGLVYLGIVGFEIMAAQRKYARIHIDI